MTHLAPWATCWLLAGIVAAVASGAAAQAPAAQPTPQRPAAQAPTSQPAPQRPAAGAPAASPRATASRTPAAQQPFTVRRNQITVVNGAIFRVGRDTYRIDDLKVPRPSRGQCYFERVRGREARKALRRFLDSGEPIVITPTGQTSNGGNRLATLTVAGRSARQAMIEAGAGMPLKGNETSVPWCLGGAG